MKRYFIIAFLFLICFVGSGQNNSKPDFEWGNTLYFNLNIGESIFYNSIEIKLLECENHWNKISINSDTAWLKVSRRSMPLATNGIRLFVADNVHVKNLTDDKKVHALLTKHALICVSDYQEQMLDQRSYIFPVSFNDGFLWNGEEDSYMFSYYGKSNNNNGNFLRSYEGIGIDLSDARGIEKHWLVAIENSTVMWIEDKGLDEMEKEACVLLQSNSNPRVFYMYNHLFNGNIEVRKGQKLIRGELIGTAWGDEKWGHVQLAVVKSDTVPSYEDCFSNSINFFPQLYQLYHQQSYIFTKTFSRGRLEFGRSSAYNRNEKNNAAFEEYLGKGWLLGRWNTADKVENAEKGADGNVRLKKVLFSGEKAACRNPKNYYDYEINVKNGVYRVRAKVGDLFLPSWQKVEFESVAGASYDLDAGKFKWTTERVVKVTDRKLTIRIYVDEYNTKVAGLSEIVFQQAY